jgi:hypothetical protein
MGLWYRVFAARDEAPDPAALLAHLNALGARVEGRFQGEGAAWWSAELGFAEKTTPLHLDRFLAAEEGIRAELNSWAAYLETCDYSPQYAPLMERIIQTKQLFTLRRPVDHADEVLVERLCAGLCAYLARLSDGVWQEDGRGFFAADGTLLLQEY